VAWLATVGIEVVSSMVGLPLGRVEFYRARGQNRGYRDGRADSRLVGSWGRCGNQGLSPFLFLLAGKKVVI
jgi:hypothetical protein